MTLISLHRGAPRGFGKGGAAPLSRTLRKLRAAFRTIHAAIAAAKLHRLRNELLCQSRSAARARVADPARQPQQPLLLDDKWDF